MVLYCQTPGCGFSYDDSNTCAPGPDPACPYCGGTEYKEAKPLPSVKAERACAEKTRANFGAGFVDIICGEPESKHTPENARADVGLDHKFIPATWDTEAQ
jgi:hypothetical protein